VVLPYGGFNTRRRESFAHEEAKLFAVQFAKGFFELRSHREEREGAKGHTCLGNRPFNIKSSVMLFHERQSGRLRENGAQQGE
jgi:hypothetical protein